MSQASSPMGTKVDLGPPPSLGLLVTALWKRFRAWSQQDGRFYVLSMLLHMASVLVIALIAGRFVLPSRTYAPTFDTTIVAELPETARFKIGEVPLDPTLLNAETLAKLDPEPIGQKKQYNDDSPIFEEKGGGKPTDRLDALGGLGGFEIKTSGGGPTVAGIGGVGVSVGVGENSGHGGAGSGFGSRGKGKREEMLGTGGTPGTERAVAAALNWLARHQNKDGSWSLDEYTIRCKDKTCTGEGEITSDAAATAMALLPFLGAGETHTSDSIYRENIARGLQWLMKNQQSDGNLAGRSAYSLMYTHGLAAIAVCEAYGLSKDSQVGAAAQKAIRFIEEAQDPEGGGWRYTARQTGDTSVVGWQVMALKSAQMAGLSVHPNTFRGANKFLKSVATGSGGNEFSYLAGEPPSATMTAVGLLCSQYLGATREDAIMGRGMEYLLRNMPTNEERDVYYWYYGTQVMHNLPGKQWDTWNRAMRRILIESQDTQGCATGSWNPREPKHDIWGIRGGRLMQTSLSALTLEIYYRYLPLYKLDGVASAASTASPPGEQAAK